LIHALPVGVGGRWVVLQDVILQGEIPNGEEELVASSVVVADGDVEDNRDEGLDVVDNGGLDVEVGDRSGLVEKERLAEIVGIGDVGGRLLLIGGGIAVVRSSGGGSRAHLLGAREGIPNTLLDGFALLDGGAGLLFGSGGAC